MPQPEQPLVLAQVESVSENTNFLQESDSSKQETTTHHKKREDLDTGVSSVK